MNLLTINAGSSSVRLELLTADGTALSTVERLRHEVTGGGDATALLDKFAATGIALAVHRVVHGGEYACARLIDAEVEQTIERLSPLAPLHNPAALAWIRAVRQAHGAKLPQVAVFDTAFFHDLPALASTYALPAALRERHGIRRYGFHGIAHKAMWQAWTKLRPQLAAGGRLISLQLGAGCSMAAVAGGRAVDTSMGFSPLEGLVMATRPGDVDPGILTYLLRERALAPADLEVMLNNASGLLGVSGTSGDMRELLASSREEAHLAVDIYCYRARKYLGAYLAVLGGADGVVFGGGVGEHAPEIRRRILGGLEAFGIELDEARNLSAVPGNRLSPDSAAVDVRVLAVDEARVMAAEAMDLFHAGADAAHER